MEYNSNFSPPHQIKEIVTDAIFDRYTVLVEKRKQDVFVRDDPNLCW